MTNKKQHTGQALVEFALILPVLLIVTFGIIDFGRILFTYSLGANSMRDAVRSANILGYQGTLPSYQDCDAIRAEFDGTLNDIFLNLDQNDIDIEYFQTDNLGSGFVATGNDPLSTATPVADCDNGTTPPSPQNAAQPFENGDIMRISIETNVAYITPFLGNTLGDLQLNFVGQRSIVTRLDFADDPDDTDNDGLSDTWEVDEFGSLECYTGTDDGDSGGHTAEAPDGSQVTCPAIDGDGCDLLCEAVNQSNPEISDTDGDGLTDGEESNGLTSLTEADTDGDGRTDAEEVLGLQPPATNYTQMNSITLNINGETVVFVRNPTAANERPASAMRTNPINPDTDGDGFGDGQELGPGNRSETPTDHDSTVTANLLINGSLESRTFLLNPASPDTDGDGWSDNSELDGSRNLSITVNDDPYTVSAMLTDPTHHDTDGDGLQDGPPGDNANELTHDADPTDNDTDSDQYNDGHEVYGADPTASLPFGPGDYGVTISINGGTNNLPISGDDLSNGLEPNQSDSDGDGLQDGFELRTNGSDNLYQTSPIDPDTDGDASAAVLAAYGIDNMSPELFYDGAELNRSFNSQDYSSDPTSRQTDNDDGASGVSTPQSDPADDMPPEDDRDTTGFDLPDSYEFTVYRTNPNAGDTDGDGITDWEEIYHYCGYDDDNDPNTPPIPVDPLDPDEPFAGGSGNKADLTLCSSNAPPTNDADGDGISDSDETSYGTDPNDADSDNDGLNDYDEIFNYGTNPNALDSDGDDINDEPEIFAYGTDPASADTDNDGIDDGVEVGEDAGGKDSQTNPTNPDTDGDGLVDGLEYNGLDAYYYGEGATGVSGLGGGLLIGMGESDVPTNGAVRMDPNDTDSDNDGYPDGVEAAHLTGQAGLPALQGVQVEHIIADRSDPAIRSYFLVSLRPDHADTDGDGINDNDEPRIGTYPHLTDTDGDTLADDAERTHTHSTDPTDPDTDGDGIDDGRELNGFAVTFPNLPDVTLEPWANVVSDPSKPGINPNNPDTDGDDIPDGVELQYSNEFEDPKNSQQTTPYNFKTYPHKADSDGDCLTDYQEAIEDSTDPTDASDFTGNGCGSSTNTPPDAKIQFDMATNCPARDQLPVECTFTSISTDPDGDSIDNYEWRVLSNDATSITATDIKTVTYEFNSYGEYTVELRVEDDAASPLWSSWEPLTFTLADNTPPDAQIQFSPDDLTAGGDCDLTQTPVICTFGENSSDTDGDDINNYEWTVQGNPGSFDPNNNGSDSNVADPQYSFPDFGEYTVTLRVQDDANTPLWSTTESMTFTLSNDLDGDWITTGDENGIYLTDPTVSQRDCIRSTYRTAEGTPPPTCSDPGNAVIAGFDEVVEEYLTSGTMSTAGTYTATQGGEIRIKVFSVPDKFTKATNGNGNYQDFMASFGMTSITVDEIVNKSEYSATGYVSGEELIYILLENNTSVTDDIEINYIEWAP